MLLNDFFSHVYRPRRPKMRSARSATSYLISIRLLNRYFRSCYLYRPSPARDVTTADLSDFLVSGFAQYRVDQGAAPATVNRDLRSLRAIWRMAAKPPKPGDAAQWTPPAAMPEVDDHPEPTYLPSAWTVDEMNRLLAAAGKARGRIGTNPAGLWFPMLILTVYWTGGRINAVMSSRREHLDAAACTLTLHPDTQKQYAEQCCDLPADLATGLAGLDSPNDRIFGAWSCDANAAWWQQLTRRLATIQKRADLPTTRKDKWHKIRKTFATQVTIHSSIETASAMLGHSSVSVTRRYVDTRQVSRPSATALLPKLTTDTPALRVVG